MLHAWTADAEQRTSIYTLRTVEGRCLCISQEIMQVGDREKQLATGLLLKHARTHSSMYGLLQSMQSHVSIQHIQIPPFLCSPSWRRNNNPIRLSNGYDFTQKRGYSAVSFERSKQAHYSLCTVCFGGVSSGEQSLQSFAAAASNI